MIKGYKGIEPKIDETAFVAESVDIIGKVNIGKKCKHLVWDCFKSR